MEKHGYNKAVRKIQQHKCGKEVIMPGAKIGKNVVIEKAVIGADAVIGDGAKVGVNSSDDNKYASKLCTNDLVLIESGAEVGVEEDICKGSMVEA